MWARLLWWGLSHVAVCWHNWVTLVTGFGACQYAIHSFPFTRSVPSVLGPHGCLLSSCMSALSGLHILLRALMSLACLSTSLPGSSCSASCRHLSLEIQDWYPGRVQHMGAELTEKERVALCLRLLQSCSLPLFHFLFSSPFERACGL